MADQKASLFSIAMAEQIAVGHFNAGLERYQKLQTLVNEDEFDDEGEKALKYSEFSFSAITNFALALEVIIKMHHFQIHGDYPRGHDIQKLGNSLPEESLDVIRAKYNDLSEDSDFHQGLSFRVQGGPSNRKKKEWPVVEVTNFDDAIDYIGEMYVRWRYIYEEFQSEVDIQVMFGPLVLAFLAVREAVESFKGNVKMTINPGTA